LKEAKRTPLLKKINRIPAFTGMTYINITKNQNEKLINLTKIDYDKAINKFFG